MRKILCTAFAILIFIFTLTGCAKCVSVETSTVQVKIVDKYHRSTYFVPRRIGKVRHIVGRPAVYRITVEYNGDEYEIGGREIYDKYSDRVGESVDGVLESRQYDDGHETYDIIGLK